MGFNIFKACFSAPRTEEPAAAPPSTASTSSRVSPASTAFYSASSGESGLEVLAADPQVRRLETKLVDHARLAQANSLIAQGKFSDAKKIYESVLARNPPGCELHTRAVDVLALLSRKLKCVSLDRSKSAQLRDSAKAMSAKLATRADSLRSNRSA